MLCLISGGGAASASGSASERTAAKPTAPQAVSSSHCGRTLYKSRKMNAEKVRRFVRIFTRGLRSGRDIGSAFGVASSGTGIGSLPGIATLAVSRIAGGLVLDFIERKLLRSLAFYRRVGIKIQVGCRFRIPYPKLRLYGDLIR